MRELYVIEVVDSSGTFQPQVGLSTLVGIHKWMEKFLPADIYARTADWRIVKYVPLDIEMVDVPIIH